jgi:hypothetical protein
MFNLGRTSASGDGGELMLVIHSVSLLLSKRFVCDRYYSQEGAAKRDDQRPHRGHRTRLARASHESHDVTERLYNYVVRDDEVFSDV